MLEVKTGAQKLVRIYQIVIKHLIRKEQLVAEEEAACS
jgi:hypothetical protein